MSTPALTHEARVTAHSSVSAALARYSDDALRNLVAAAEPLGSGIGGTTARMEVAGSPVFVKRVPLTDLELQPEHVRSTANLFGVPDFCRYGVGLIGGPGFGAWRELAVHARTTDWVLAAESEAFPLMHHWRVLPGPTPLPEELADVARAVAYWEGSPQVRRRIEALAQSRASIALFLEYVPQNLHQWLGTQIEAGDEAADRACAMVERQLADGVRYMNSRGLLHFDAHFENILTDGRRLFFGDYGLALSSGFELSPDEVEFFGRNQAYDSCYTVTYLVNWLVTALHGLARDDRDGRLELVRGYAAGKRPEGLPQEAAAIIARHAPTAAVVSEFNRAFQRESRRTPYPVEEIRLLGGVDEGGAPRVAESWAADR